MNKLRIWNISDTHEEHHFLTIPDNIDMVIHSGDEANPKDPYRNEPACRDFINWFKNLPIKYKIFVAGNHSTAIEKRLITRKDFEDNNIIYLEHESIQINGINIFGSPYTPEFHSWAFNVKRDKLFNYWELIPEDTHILVTHGPPKFILDMDHYENLGCLSLYKRIKKLPKLLIHQFGHIHDNRSSGDNFINRGIFIDPSTGVKFINASCVDVRHNLQPGNIITEIELP